MPQSKPEDRRETEVKLAVPSAEAARSMLERAGFSQLHDRAFEANSVFDTQDQALMRSGQLLRLRSFRGEAILTFKGPTEPGPHKVRPEHETNASNAAALQTILESLGYQLVFRYEKYRTTFQRNGETGHALLDETPIGVFVELEGPADWIDSTGAQLGFGRGDYILKSYGTLYRDYCDQAGVKPTHMVFTV